MSDTSSPVRPKPPARRSAPVPLYRIVPAAKNPAAAPASLVERLRNLREGPMVFHALVRLGDQAVPALEDFVRGPSDAVHQPRCLASDVLAAIGSAAAVDALCRAMLDSAARDPAPQLLEAESILVNHIAEHLSRFPRPEVTEALLSALRRRRYAYCAAALGLTGDPRAIPLLVECLYEDAARPAAMAALRRFAADALESLVRALLEPPSAAMLEPPSHLDGRVAAARLLGEFARADSQGASFAVSALKDALSDSQGAVRIEAALGLVRSGARTDGQIARILVSALGEESWARAEEIMQVLVRIGPAAERLLIPLIGVRPRDGADRRRRVRAVEALGRLGSVSAEGMLRRVHTAGDTTLRVATVKALASIGGADARSLALFLSDPHPTIRLRALQALIDRRALDPTLAVRLLADEDSRVRSLAARALREDIAGALPALKRVAAHGGAPVEGFAPRLRLWWHACVLIGTAGRRTRRC